MYKPAGDKFDKVTRWTPNAVEFNFLIILCNLGALSVHSGRMRIDEKKEAPTPRPIFFSSFFIIFNFYLLFFLFTLLLYFQMAIKAFSYQHHHYLLIKSATKIVFFLIF